jgi:prepilin-type N-terminal cleavage/methylation domain-containing protein
MGCAHKENQDGFTLVEISIVMIIIGLLIGGTFGGMRLIENAQINKTIQDLKSFDALGITFKDAYGRLPGVLRNPSTRLPHCASAPCSISGNGDRLIGGFWDTSGMTPILVSDERVVFWQHALAANLIDSVQPVSSLDAGVGQPESSLGGAYRHHGMISIGWTGNARNKHIIWISDPTDPDTVQCSSARRLDEKIDDGRPTGGRMAVWGSCPVDFNDSNSAWASPPGDRGAIIYYLAY